jgi:hypothetical protein
MRQSNSYIKKLYPFLIKNLKTPLGIIGLLFLLLGLVMNLWMFISGWWPTYLYFIATGFGIFFLLINSWTKKLPFYLLWQVIIGIAPLLAFYLLLQSNETSEDIFIIPENFKGTMVVIYDQENGAKKEFEKGKRVYRIPKDGVLKTQFKIKGKGLSYGEYFFETKEKKRIKIKRYLDSTEVYVKDWEFGISSGGKYKKHTFQRAIIGTMKDRFE